MRSVIPVFFALALPCCSDPDPATICDPGATQRCVCPDASDGAQVCADDGTRWGSCVCHSRDGGYTDASSTDRHQVDAGSTDVQLSDAQPWADLPQWDVRTLYSQYTHYETACSVHTPEPAGYPLEIILTCTDPCSDIDLHLVRVDGELNTSDDCYYSNCKSSNHTINWGSPSREDDPRLQNDDVTGCGPESIFATQLPDGEYKIVANIRTSSTVVFPMHAVSVFFDKGLAFEKSSDSSACGAYQSMAILSVIDGGFSVASDDGGFIDSGISGNCISRNFGDFGCPLHSARPGPLSPDTDQECVCEDGYLSIGGYGECLPAATRDP